MKQFGGYKTCNQCGQTTEGILGDIDPKDGYWYCSRCWDGAYSASNPVTKEHSASNLTTQDEQQQSYDPEELSISTSIAPSVSIMSRCQHPVLGYGTVRYIGKISSKIGIFAGIELDEARGKHDGRVFNVRYFQTEPKHAAFMLKSKVDVIKPEQETDFKINEEVIIKSLKFPNNHGIIKYIGGRHDTYGLWFGIELNQPHSRGHNGRIDGKKYFVCKPKTGLLLKETNISHLFTTTNPEIPDIPIVPDASEISQLPTSPTEPFIPPIPGLPPVPVVNIAQFQISTAPAKIRIGDAHHHDAAILQAESLSMTKQEIMNGIKKISEIQPKILLDQNVYIPRLGMGIIKYIGNEYAIPIQQLQEQNLPNFIDTVIIGISLQDPKGTTDGTLKDLKLFSCPPKHGLYIRYNRINDIRSIQRQLIKQLLDCQSHINANISDIMHITNLMLDLSITNGGGQTGNIFRALEEAIQSRDLKMLKDSLQQAFICNIPPSAPKIIHARRIFHELRNPHLNAPKSTPNVQGRLPISTTPQQRTNSPNPNSNPINVNEQNDEPDINVSVKRTVRNPKSLHGRTDEELFRMILVYFMLELFVSLALCTVLIIDSIWVGFPLYIAIAVIIGIIVLDYMIMYQLNWTRWINQLVFMSNICVIVMMVQTMASGYGTTLTGAGCTFIIIIVIKLFLMSRFKARLIGKRNRFKSSKTKKSKDIENKRKINPFNPDNNELP